MGKTFCFPILMALSLAWLSFAKFMDHVPSSNDFGLDFPFSIFFPFNMSDPSICHGISAVTNFSGIFPGFSLDLHTFPTTFPGSLRGVTATVTSFALEAGWVTSYCEIAQRVQTKRLDTWGRRAESVAGWWLEPWNLMTFHLYSGKLKVRMPLWWP